MTELRTRLRDRLDHVAPVAVAEIQQTANTLRRRRNRARWSFAALTTSVVAVVATLIALSAGGSSAAHVVPVDSPSAAATGPAPAVPGYDLTISVVPDVTSVKAGTPIPVTVTLNNTSGHVLKYGGCGNFFVIGLSGPVVSVPAQTLCLRIFDVPPGVSSSRQSLSTTWSNCINVGGSGPSTPACDETDPNRPLPPPLPTGQYRIVIPSLFAGVTLAPTPTIILR